MFKDSQLARRLVVATVLFSSVLTLALTGLQLYWQYRQDVSSLNQSADIIRDSWLESLTESIWDYDTTLIDMQLNGMVNLPYVVGVVLDFVDGEQLEAGSSLIINPKYFDHPLHYDSGGRVRYLGKLQVVMDMDLVYSDLWRFALTILISNTLKAGLVVAFMLIMIHYLFVQHLAHIVTYLNHRHKWPDVGPLMLKRPKKHQSDEIDALVMAFNQLQREVNDEHQRLLNEGVQRAQLQHQLAQLDRQITMGEMATSLAHELNQPLASITGYADICSRFAFQDNHAMLDSTLEKISSEALRASEIIRRTREFVRSRSMQRERLPLAALVTDTTAIMAHAAQQQGVELQIPNLPLPPWYVNGDKIQLQQVLVNLLKNAIDAQARLDQPDKWVRVTLRQYDEGRVAVMVDDNGPGIDPQVIETLFQPFVSTKPDGMGVGLAISHNIVEAHGGELGAFNTKLGGALFEIVLPLEEVN